jgi:hypothetical protein
LPVFPLVYCTELAKFQAIHKLIEHHLQPLLLPHLIILNLGGGIYRVIFKIKKCRETLKNFRVFLFTFEKIGAHFLPEIFFSDLKKFIF